MRNIYQDHGYDNRDHYLNSLADDSGVPIETVRVLADLLGESEDFDGLVVAVQDAGDDYA